ncbi:hypothetical protein [Paenibacillus darwinianus]|nr:hypothetical protein [Paenibacillus darwinianus]
MTMTIKTASTSGQQHEREGKRLFSFMNILAWIALGIGVVMSVANMGFFSDDNLPLMLGIGFMVGSVFIYTIGTAINMVEQRKQESETTETVE